MKIKKVLIVYKKSSYQFYFLKPHGPPFKELLRFTRAVRTRFKKAHDEHYKTLTLVEKILTENKVEFKKYYRGQTIDYEPFDLVITVGGDGTFLEAAHNVSRQLILGVNSDPKRSIGRLCTATRENFERVFTRVLKGQCKISGLNRLHLKLGKDFKGINVLNDLLVCHQNPAAMSRYALSFNGATEDQRGSGLWISTAVGSSGAMRSAGGKVLPRLSRHIQYKPRELFQGRGVRYRLRGGVVTLKNKLTIRSLMRTSMIYIDGAHCSFPFSFGDVATITNSKMPLRVISR